MMKEIALIQKAVSKVFGDVVSKVVSDGVDALKSAIKDADLDRKSYNQNLQTRLYQLIVDALNRFTYNKFENQDKLYDAAESIIRGYISSKENTDAVKSGLKMLVSGVNDDTCQEFLEILCGEICRDENNDLYKEIDMLWKKQEREYIHGEFEKSNQYDREVLRKLNGLKEALEFLKKNANSQRGAQAEYHKMPIENRTDEYAQRWNKNVFLNNFNKRDKNAGVNIKLQEIYLEKHLPHYKWRLDDKPSTDLKELLREYIVDNDDKKMLLILGQPGIGKSTLITWIMANIIEKEENILVYQFASDLCNVNWQSGNLLDEIFAAIGLEYSKLEGKSLILDGFDEIYVKGDRERILHKIKQELEKKNFLKKFSLIITCRENYVKKAWLEGIEYITLQSWDEEQIRSFCEVYEEIIMRRDSTRANKNSEVKTNKIIEKKDIMGIPLILYMVLALEVDIERSSSTVDIYDQIFSLERGGIYDRCYDAAHRISAPEIKEHIHHISQLIAFWMFENSADKAIISWEKFEEICENEMKESGQKDEGIKSDTLIGNFFQLKHCEGKGTSEIQFVHRSIYEYFVTVYFLTSIKKVRDNGNDKIKEELEKLLITGHLSEQILEFVAGKLGELLKRGRLSKQILEFVKYKFDNIKKYNLSDIIKKIFNKMLRHGMTYYTKVEEPYNNVIERERNIFSNMLEIVGLWNSSLGKLDERIIIYLQCNREEKLNLSGIQLCIKNVDMGRVDLKGANLKEANLRGADLSEADLSRVNLKGANLKEANLIGTNLRRANLVEADLRRANLNEADLNEADLNEASLNEADLRGVDLSRTDLRRTNLRGTNLRGTNLKGANLKGANLIGADLIGANLRGADLNKTIFDKEQVNKLHKKYDLCKSMVFLTEENEVISYQEYCIQKQKG